jgi:hypothetical protein
MFSQGSTRAGSGAPAAPAYDFIATPRPAGGGNSMFGAPAVAPAAVAAPTFGHEYVPGYLPLGQGRSTRSKVLIGVGIAAALVVLLAVLTAIAVPVYLKHRDAQIAAHTTVSLPATVAGLPKLKSSAQLQAMAGNLPQLGPVQAGMYGKGARRVAVVAGAHALDEGDQHSFMTGVTQQMVQSHLQPVKVDPGPLGGVMDCTTSSTKTTTCVFADAGAIGTISVNATGPAALATVREVRSAVEHRS